MHTISRIKQQLLTVAISAALVSSPVMAAEPDLTPQHIGAGSGAVAGAIFAGPIGLIVGTALGAMIGNHEVQQQQLDEQQLSHQQDLTRLNQAHATTQQELARAAQQLAERRAELAASTEQLESLSREQAALKQMISGLKLSVYFAQNSSEVDPRYQELLQSLSQAANPIPGLKIDLAGHANASGPEEHNLRLSQQRGAAVQEQLQQHGLPPFRVLRDDKGERVSSNNPYAAKDRRVDLQFRFDQGPKGEQLFSVR